MMDIRTLTARITYVFGRIRIALQSFFGNNSNILLFLMPVGTWTQWMKDNNSDVSSIDPGFPTKYKVSP